MPKRAPVVAIAVLSALSVAAAVGDGRNTLTADRGAERWVAHYDAGSFDVGRDLAVSPDGRRVYVAGYSYVDDTADYATVAYDSATGEELWSARYDGPAHEADIAEGLGVSPDGSLVFVTGGAAEGDHDSNYVTIAYEAATGRQVWLRNFEGQPFGEDSGLALGVSPDGRRLFVTGRGPGYFGSTTIAYSSATGAQLWVVQHDPGVGEDLSVAPDGSRVYVTGGHYFFTVGINAVGGTLAWDAYHPGEGFDGANAVAVTPDGSRVFVTGDLEAVGADPDPDYVTIGYEARIGLELGLAAYDGPHDNDYDISSDVAVSPDGRSVFVTGRGAEDLGVRPEDYVSVAYDIVQGSRRWVARYNGTDHRYDSADALAVSPDGNHVVVTGQSDGPGTGRDYATVAYRADSGRQVWAGRYDGPDDGDDYDRAYAVAFSSDGETIFITGEAGGDTNVDFVTIAYDSAALLG